MKQAVSNYKNIFVDRNVITCWVYVKTFVYVTRIIGFVWLRCPLFMTGNFVPVITHFFQVENVKSSKMCDKHVLFRNQMLIDQTFEQSKLSC